ncbi:MAG: hypothetical protein IKB75_06010 [Clostridia bacterium]|nr:hypothetical protein [Clostridia bacterium]
MKKNAALVLCLMMILSLFSCSGSGDQGPLPTEPSSTTASPTTEVSTTAPPQENPEPTLKDLQNELALQAYGAAIRNEINVYYPLLNNDTPTETYFERICGSEKGNPMRQALVDMDRDGIEELILKYGSFFVILHFENNKVYGTDFHFGAMEMIYTDGSFSWSHTDDMFGYECGISRVSFANGIMKVEELCRKEGDSRFFISGAQVTKEQYDDYLDGNERTPVDFAPFDIYFLDSDALKAIELASEYWGIKDGDFDPERGLRYRVICKRKIDEGRYEVSLYRFIYNRSYEHFALATVKVDTGEITVEKYPDGKG